MSPRDDAVRIRLSEERKAAVLRRLTELYARDFDEELSGFRSGLLLDFFLKTLGPLVYNQALQDARKYMADRLDDLDATFSQPEEALPGALHPPPPHPSD